MLLKKTNRVSDIFSRSWGFIFRKKFMINLKYKSSMFASRDVCMYFSKKTWSHPRCYTYTNYTYTRCLLDIKTWNVSSRRFLQFSYLMRPLSLKTLLYLHISLTTNGYFLNTHYFTKFGGIYNGGFKRCGDTH